MSKNEWFHYNKPRPALVLLVLLIAFYILNGIIYLQSQSITFDEVSFVDYAARLVKGHTDRIKPRSDNSKMPIVVINLIPRAVSQLFHPGLKKTDNGSSDIFAGRYITLLVSVFTILLVYQWSKELFGEKAGLFSAFLLCFCPNMIANAGLVTTDSYSMLFLTATMYFLWKFFKTPGIKYFSLLSIFIGFSQLVKQSLFHLYILVPIILLVYYFIFKPVIRWKVIVSYTVLFLFINWLIINLGFYFQNSNTVLGNYHFSSALFIRIQKLFPAWLILPFPKAFVTGLDLSKYYDQIGGGDDLIGSFGKVTILGNSSTGGSFWYYYFVSIFFKTPISSLIFISLSLIIVARRFSLNDFFKNAFFLLAPVFYFLVYMSFLYKTQIGIRQLIFIYPLLYVQCGVLLRFIVSFKKRLVFAGLIFFLVISLIRYWRNYYPYTNEFIADKKMAYQYVGAANLEIGQAGFFLTDFLQKHPDVKWIGTVPETGYFLITINDYLDVWNRHRYDWIKNIKPYSQVAYSGLLIKVIPDDLTPNIIVVPGE